MQRIINVKPNLVSAQDLQKNYYKNHVLKKRMLRNAKIKASIANGGMMFHKKMDGEPVTITAPDSLEIPR